MLIYVRHGATLLNAAGSEERLRGWLPAPLSDKGIQQAKSVGLRLRKYLPQMTSFTVSDLPRALQTAQIIGGMLGQQAVPQFALRDWNTGNYAGQKVDDMLPALHGLIQHPLLSAPNGERFMDYTDRFIPYTRSLVMDPGVHVAIGHARGASVIEGLASPIGGKGGDVDESFVLGKPNLDPGDAMVITPDWNIHKLPDLEAKRRGV